MNAEWDIIGLSMLWLGLIVLGALIVRRLRRNYDIDSMAQSADAAGYSQNERLMGWLGATLCAVGATLALAVLLGGAP